MKDYSRALDDFRRAMNAHGLVPPDHLQADGRIHRCGTADRPRRRDAAYVLHLNGWPAGGFQNHRDGMGWQGWRAEGSDSLTPAQRAAERQRADDLRRERDAETARRHARAAQRARKVWDAAKPAPAGHAYLSRKGVAAHGLRIAGERLLVPVYADGALVSLQAIAADGAKRFLPGGRTAGGYFPIGRVADTVCIAEGFATAASIHAATGYAVAAAFNCGNLEAVARSLADRYPQARLIVCADDDCRTTGNPGVTKAKAAAEAVGAAVAVPDFGNSRPDGATDFNDLARSRGPEAVCACLAAALSPAWTVPQPLVTTDAVQPYPLAELPEGIRNAVAEVQAFTRAPVALVAASALSVVSLATQALADVQRTEGLRGPVSLFLLSVAESGERKSSADKYFTAGIADWEQQQQTAAKPALADYRARLDSWTAKRDGLLARIKSARKAGKDSRQAESELADLEASRPEAPRVPRLLRVDSTAEALAYSLAHEWPSAGVLSAEAGLLFGSHGMNPESQMRHLAQMNVIWDGGQTHISRRTKESFTLRGARLTLGLQVQAGTLRAFFDRSRGLARDTGFLARFLFAWPDSTQGQRLFREAPRDWPAVAAFQGHLLGLLDALPTLDPDGSLSLPCLALDGEGKQAWARFHDDVERELAPMGELADVRDVASKAAENVARLAALFHVWQHGPSGSVGADSVMSAARIVAWHLTEARRFFGALALPVALADAARLDAWLRDYCRARQIDAVSTRDVQRFGPVRDRQRLDTALAELVDAGRFRVDSEGKQRLLRLNPALLDAHHGAA